MPTAERMKLDARFIELYKAGNVSELVQWLPVFSREAAVEMGGRVLASMLGCAAALAGDAGGLRAEMYGEYAQSSGSGNAVLCLRPL